MPWTNAVRDFIQISISTEFFFYRLQTYVGVHAAKHAKIVLCFIASINVLEENQLSLHHPQNVCYQVFNFNSTED